MQHESTDLDTPGDASVQRARRCSACGGLNPPAAQWCGQCLTRFDDDRAPEAPSQLDGEPGPAAPEVPRRRTTEGEETIVAGNAAFHVSDEGITWTCSICDAVNDLERSICEVCSAPFAQTVLPPEEKPQRDPNMAALLSLFLPGAGHAYIGHWGQAIARAVISLWVVMVVFVAAVQRGAASSNVIMGIFGVVATALWGLGAHDAYREARDERTLVILKGKVFFYMVLGLLLLLVALLMSAMIKAQR